MAKSYLVYEKRTAAELPVAIFDTVTACARFMGVSREHAQRMIAGKKNNPHYGIFVDVYNAEEEGQYTATTAPIVHSPKG